MMNAELALSPWMVDVCEQGRCTKLFNLSWRLTRHEETLGKGNWAKTKTRSVCVRKPI